MTKRNATGFAQFDWRKAIDALLGSGRAIAAAVVLIAVVALLLGMN